MRLWIGLLFLPVTALVHAACVLSNDGDCTDKATCPPGSSGGNGGTGANGGNGGDGGGGGTPAGCVPADNDTAVANDCGVFVSSSLGDDGNTGTKESPFKTIGVAIGAAGSGDVYVCAEAFNEAVTLPSGTALFGGLDCANGWTYSGDKVQLTSAADTIPLTLTPGTSETRIEDFAITAEDASIVGGSSIAVIADQASVDFARCELRAGSGESGEPGTSPGGTAMDGTPGFDGKMGCLNPGPFETDMPPTVTCTDGTTSTGGPGGDGNVTNGGNGTDGDSNPAVMTPEDNDGDGQTGSGAGLCKDGTFGADGDQGPHGLGGTVLGVLSSLGYVGAAGDAGMRGGPGQGGGGGGGAKGQVACSTATNAGPSGGTGGTGGCGGAPGLGGQAGGSSIALLSIASTVTLTASSLTAGDAGNGGDGGDGQTGGSGRTGGITGTGGTNNQACGGGPGGGGGDGGSGGGGHGGHSLGIAFTGTEPTHDGSTVTPGAEGAGGLGGLGNTPTGDGAPGTAVETLSFD